MARVQVINETILDTNPAADDWTLCGTYRANEGMQKAGAGAHAECARAR